MANEIKIEAYYVEIRDIIKNKSKSGSREFYSLDDVRGVDFLEVLLTFLKTFQFTRDHQLQKSFSILSTDESMVKTRMIAGIYESGEFGYSSKVRDSGGKSILAKSKEASVDIPFFFHFYIPKGKTKGILIFQKLGVNGGYTIFRKKLTEYCNKEIPNKVMDFSAILSAELARTMINTGIFKELIIKKKYVPRDRIELLDSGSNDATLSKTVSFNILIKASERGKSLGLKRSLNSFLKDKKIKVFAIPELDIYLGKSYLVSTKIRWDGADRVLDLTDSMQIKPLYDVTKDVSTGSGGHPTYESILTVSKSILKDLIKLEK